MTQEEQQPPRIKIRIESLSDLVFGLALSIGSIVLVSSNVSDIGQLEGNVADFGFSFVIIVFTWLGYTRTMAALPGETPTSLYLNILLLFLVAVEPYLFFVLVSAKGIPLAESFSVPYALNVAAIFLVQGALARLVIHEDRRKKLDDKNRLHPEVLARFRRIAFSDVIIGILYLLSTLPIFWIQVGPTYLRFIIWFSSFSIFFVVRGLARKPKTLVQTQV